MAWTIELTDSAERALAKLDKPTARRIRDFLRDRLAPLDDPRSQGRALRGFPHLWRYRLGDYRLVASIEDAVLRILVVRIGHRRDVYR